MKRTFGNLSDSFLSREQMKKIKGGIEMDGGDDSNGCVNTCSTTCACEDSRDWCVDGLCKTRP